MATKNATALSQDQREALKEGYLTILGIDPGDNFGLAILREIPLAKTVPFTPHENHEPPSILARAFLDISDCSHTNLPLSEPYIRILDLKWFNFKPSRQRKKKNKDPAEKRYLDTISLLEQLIGTNNISVIAYESQIWTRSHRSTDILKGYQTIIATVAAKANIPTIPINIRTLKRFATGRGNALKNEMRTYFLNMLSQNWHICGKPIKLIQNAKIIMNCRDIIKDLRFSSHEIDAAWAALFALDQIRGIHLG